MDTYELLFQSHNLILQFLF